MSPGRATWLHWRAALDAAPLTLRLRWLLTSVAVASAAIGCLALAGVGAWFQLAHTRGEAGEIARTLAYTLRAPLAFEDVRAIRDSLEALGERPKVAGAWVADADGRVVGRWGALGERDPGTLVDDAMAGPLVVALDVMLEQRRVGRLTLAIGLGDMHRTLAIELAAILAGSGAGLALALALGRRLAARIAEPMTSLARASAAIAAGGDYTRRLDGAGADEIGAAVRSFNRMLDEVQARDAALADANRTLERRIAERTDALARETRRAVDASQAKTRFLATMSHELRTPLNAVIGAAQLLQPARGAPGQAQLVGVVRDGGAALLTLIEDVLDMARIESGALEVARVPFDLVECVESVLAAVAVTARAKGLALAAVIDPALPAWRSGDPVRLAQVLRNLAGNAVKFTLEGEVVIRVGVGAAADDLRFTVEDSGIGIDAQTQRRLFQPFAQADQSATRRFGGSGLGLAISRQLATAMGGTIAVASELGRGSRFTLSLALPQATPPSPEPALDPFDVAVLEPHEASAEALVALLARIGCTPQRCRTGADLRAWQRATAGAGWVLADAAALAAAGTAVDPARLVELSALAAAEPHDGARSLLRPVLRPALEDALRDAPLTQPAPLDALEPRHDVAPCVLVVEDDPTNRLIVCSMLERAGYRFATAESGGDALARLRERRFDLVLLDWRMPDLDGLEVARRVRAGASGAAARATPIVALTANAFAEDRAACLEAGMNDFLTKPVHAAQLVRTVERWTASREAVVAV
jgi:signal transduction histidine kinase/CheY-like chemotaxis protein